MFRKYAYWSSSKRWNSMSFIYNDLINSNKLQYSFIKPIRPTSTLRLEAKRQLLYTTQWLRHLLHVNYTILDNSFWRQKQTEESEQDQQNQQISNGASGAKLFCDGIFEILLKIDKKKFLHYFSLTQVIWLLAGG